MNDDNTYELIGRAIVAWNDLELVWYLTFLTLSDDPRPKADAEYLGLHRFYDQLKRSKSRAKAVLADENIKKALMLLAERSELAAKKRNKVAHTKYIRSSDRKVKSLSIWRIGESHLSEVSLPTDLHDMENELALIADELASLLFRICAALGKEPPDTEP
ncbi:MAG: hypothetical protein K8F25_11685 [Fimbriimonadaceae bacterium]|nr:hypothetical protein [Alphaproteobacteria bacterium]